MGTGEYRMHELKYQAWLHDEKQIVNVIEINTFDKFISYYDISHCKDDAEIFDFIRSNSPNANCPFERCSLRTYIGLNDKNKIEMYTRDIVEGFNNRFVIECGINRIKKVAYDDEIVEVDVPGFYFRSLIYNDKVYPIVGDLSGLEVIGNIDANPELLKIKRVER